MPPRRVASANQPAARVNPQLGARRAPGPWRAGTYMLTLAIQIRSRRPYCFRINLYIFFSKFMASKFQVPPQVKGSGGTRGPKRAKQAQPQLSFFFVNHSTPEINTLSRTSRLPGRCRALVHRQSITKSACDAGCCSAIAAFTVPACCREASFATSNQNERLGRQFMRRGGLIDSCGGIGRRRGERQAIAYPPPTIITFVTQLQLRGPRIPPRSG